VKYHKVLKTGAEYQKY